MKPSSPPRLHNQTGTQKEKCNHHQLCSFSTNIQSKLTKAFRPKLVLCTDKKVTINILQQALFLMRIYIASQSATFFFALILSVDNTTPTLMVSETYFYSTITFPWLSSVHLRDTVVHTLQYSTHEQQRSPLTAICFPRRHSLLVRSFFRGAGFFTVTEAGKTLLSII